MADEALVRILREGGVEAWNAFVKVRQAKDMSWKAELCEAELARADLTRADFKRADLTRADFTRAMLMRAGLTGAVLTSADLTSADLTEADLRGATLTGANLTRADLTDANLRCIDLKGSILTRAVLSNAVLSGAVVGSSAFIHLDLANVNGITEVIHTMPSALDIQTLNYSKGRIPDVFLRGCGLADWEILNARLYDPDLTDDERIDIAYEVAMLSAKAPIQPNPIFISYTHADSHFVDELQAALDEKGIRSWRDVHHAEAGPLEKVIDRAISLNPTMVLVLSQASCGSSWVRYEIAKALELEQQLGRAVLCPVAIDDAWLTVLPAQQRTEVKRYNVLDLSAPDAIEKQMPRLLKGLHIHYRGETLGE